jgi:hypothetical protein
VEACATCHSKIDPPGFALENFDVIGGWRDHYRIVPDRGQRYDTVALKGDNVEQKRVPVGPAVDASFTLESGASFHDVDEFKAILLQDKELIVRALASKLLVYATGAGIQFSDRPVLAGIVAQDRASGYGLRSLIHAVVASPTFARK